MSTVFVAPNGQFTAADPNLDIFGGSGIELVRLTAAATNADINPNVEGVDFSAPLSAFTFQVTGNVVVVRQNGVVIASVVVQDDGNGTRFRFSDGGADLVITGLNQVTLGGVPVSTAAGGAAITSAQMGANFNPDDPSSLGGQADPQAPTVTDGQSFTLNENSPNGSAVGTVLATDPDTKAPGNTLSYSITAGNDSGAFVINSASGALSVADGSKLDFETTPTFTLTVKATDGTNLSDTASVTVKLSDVNEAPTVKDAQNFVVAVSAANGSAVGSVVATDPDTTAPNKTLTYSITSGNTNTALAIDAASGAITVADKSKLDPLNPFNLTVKATDGGGLSDDALVTVTVTETNTAPLVKDGQSFSLAENSANTNVVGIVVATDGDTSTANKTLNYAITGGNTSNAFAINSSTGTITVNDTSKLDFETAPSFALTVKATDNGNPALSDDAQVTINLTDKNEAPKVNDGQNFTLAENSANATVVGSVVATDPDKTSPNNSLGFAITAGNASGAFAIDNNGKLTVADGSKLDFDTGSVFTLTVKATDGGNPALSDDATVTVTLTDKNEAPTVADNQVFSANEGTPNNTVIGIVQATDPDSTAPNKTLSYTITAGNINTAFAINAATGAISVADSSKLDFNANPVFNLTVKATDGGNPALSDDAVVQVKLGDINQAPNVAASQSFTLDEHRPNGTVVGTVIATDPDKAGTPNATLTYSITAGNTNTALAIDKATGQLTVADSTKLDFETAPGGQFTLTVRATDGAGVFDDDTVLVKLNDLNEPPLLPDGTVFSLQEHKANGSLVGSVVANDPDKNATVSYALSVNPGNAFAINAQTGAITVNDSTKLDFETTGTLLIAVKATDNKGLSDEASIQINLTDVNEAPILDDSSRSIAENALNGANVGAPLQAKDPDIGAAAPTYAIVSGNDDGAFALNASSGQITVADASKLDFETTPQVKLTVAAQDGATPSIKDLAVVTISITDANEAPTVKDGQSFSLKEMSGVDTVVGSVIATDPDTKAPNNTLSFSITGGNTGNAFKIDNSGVISVVTSAALDFETMPSFTLNVVATDGKGLSDSSSVIVALTDANEAPTVTDGQMFTVSEAAANGTAVGTVAGTDPDGTSPNKDLSWSIVTNPNNAFFINPTTGQIQVADNSTFDFEAAVNSFTLTVKATDGGGLSDTADVEVALTDANEAPTVTDNQSFSIDENKANGTAVGTVLATDPDNAGSDNGKLSYSITAGNGSGAFAINATTGAITVANSSKLDFETTKLFTLTVKATDAGNPALSDTATVKINLNDINEQPSITSDGGGATATKSIAENTKAVTTVTASDPDAATTLTFSLNGGADKTLFTIDGTTGVLSFVAAPDFEAPADAGANNVYEVQVKVSDGALSDTQDLSVTITNVNEAPVNTVPASITVTEDQATTLSGISVTDVDAGANDIKMTLSVATGTLTVTNSFGLGVSGSGTNTLVVTGDPGEISALITLGAVQYQTALNNTSTVVLNVLTDDLGNTGAGGSKTDSDNVNLVVTPVNDAPAGTVPGAQTVAENTSLTFNAGGGNLVSVADVDNDNPLTVSLDVAKGTLSLSMTAGLTFSFGDGTSDAIMAFQGSIAAINAALNGLVYTPNAGFNGGDTLNLNISDPSNATDFESVAITVTGVDDPPVITSNGGGASAAVSIAENTKAVTTVTATDAENDPISFSISGGLDAALFDIVAATGVLTFKAAPDFETPADSDTNNVYKVTVKASSTTKSDTQAIAVTVTNVNEAPVNTVPGPQTVNEDADLVFSTGNGNKIAVSDDSAILTVSLGLSKTSTGGLTLASTAGLTFSDGDGTGDKNMTFSGTIANINTALEGLKYTPAPNFFGADSLTIVTSDGSLADSDSFTISVTGVDDGQPVLDLNGLAAGKNFTGASFTENGPAVLIVDPAMTLTDPDGIMTKVTAKIGTVLNAGKEFLSVTPMGEFALGGEGAGADNSITFDPMTGLLTLDGLAPAADYEATLRTLKYSNTSDTPNTTNRVITVTAFDGVGTSNMPTSTVAVAAANDAPTITNLSIDPTGFTFTATDADSGALMSAGPLAAMAVNNGTPTTQNVAAPGAITSGTYSVTDGMAGTAVLDLYLGTNAANTISATAGPNPIAVYGFNGIDTLNGTSGKDFLFGGAGNDALDGSLGDDILDGGLNDDTLNGGFGNDLLTGGDGVDTLNGGGDNDTLMGGNGDDKLDAGPGTNVLVGGAGNDTIAAGTDPFSDPNFAANSGNDTIRFLAVMNITDQASNGSDTINNFGSGLSGAPADVIDLDLLFDSLGLSNAQRAANDGFVVVASFNTASLFIDLNGDAVFDPNTQPSPVGFEYLAATINTPFGFSSQYPNGIVDPGTL